MKKATKRTLVIAIVLVMLCTMTVTAFAGTTSKSGSFLTLYNEGTYSARLTATSDVATASLNVTVTKGTIPTGTAVLRGTVYGYVDGLVVATPIYGDGDLDCYSSVSNQYLVIDHVTCDYYFSSVQLCSLSESK